MTNILLAALLLITTLSLSLSILVILRVLRVYNEFRGFISPTGEGKPSPAALLVDAVAVSFARAAAAQIKTTFMGMQSGQVRGEKAIDAALLEDTNPLAGILSSFPAVGKAIKKNPALAQFLLDKLASKLGGGGNHQEVNSGTPRFKF